MNKEELALKLSIAYLNRSDKNLSEKDFYNLIKKSLSEFSNIIKEDSKSVTTWDVMD